MGHRTARLAALAGAIGIFGPAGQARAAEAVLRVVDVGNALCVVAKIPGDHFMLYDAGDRGGLECEGAVREIVGRHRLDLVVISHPDEDHNGELARILARTEADLIVHTGARLSANIRDPILREFDRANLRRPGSVRSLATQPLPNTRRPAPGRPRAAPFSLDLGDAHVTFVAGWTEWDLPHDRGASLSPAEKRNVISIVVRFEYGGKSVLLSGDTIGRRGRPREPVDACRDAEKWMVRDGNVPLDSDVLVGEHHGGDNSSALCFIEAVSPEWVVFSAGNSTNDHPRDSAVKRYFDTSLIRRVAPANILRTDRGDDEGALEWDSERVPGCRDPKGDDDVEIILSDVPGTRPEVHYRRPGGGCAS